MGNPAAVTPNLDNLCRTEGVSFRHAFCQSPVCTPSRCSFMSGWYPHVRGHRTMFHMMAPDEPVLLRRLREEGYFVWWGGKNDLTPGQDSIEPYCDVRNPTDWPPLRGEIPPDPAWRGSPQGDNYYSFYQGRLDKGPEDFFIDFDWKQVTGALDFINGYDGDKPLCVYLPLHFPHPTYRVEEPWYSIIDRAKVPPRGPTPPGFAGKPGMLKGIYHRQQMQNWSEERFTELRATYLGMCARVDHQYGMIADALKARCMYEDTALFVFSDHGDFTGDYGLVEKTQNTFEDCLTRVPLLIKPPSGIPVKPRISDALVELIDFPATVEALLGIEPRHTHFGRSLLPLIAGERDDHRDAVFCEGGRLHGETHCMEIESNPENNPSDLYWPRQQMQRSEGPEHTKAVMCRTGRYKYVRRLYERDELYDLAADPGEVVNRIDDRQLAPVLAELKERLLTFYLETADVVPHRIDVRN